MSDNQGRYGEFGGQYVPESLMNAVIELQKAYAEYSKDPEFMKEVDDLNHRYTEHRLDRCTINCQYFY